MGLAALSIYNITKGDLSDVDPSWDLPSINVGWNVTEATADWIRKHLSKGGQ